MPTIDFGGQHFPANPGETVLDCLLRQGLPIPHSCKAGVCQSCMMKAAPGSLLAEAATRPLKDTLRSQGYFLACSQPAADLSVTLDEAAQPVNAEIIERLPLSNSVLRLRIRTQSPLDYSAGQFVNLIRPDGLCRSYSLASLPTDDALELHIRRIPGGSMSEWLYSPAIDANLSVQGPHGNCFYIPGKPSEPLILAGTGTGLAPLYGILRDAFRHQHSGPIYLFHGALSTAGLYLVNEISSLAETHPNFTYLPSILQADPSVTCMTGPLGACISSTLPKLAGFRGYLCGDPAIVSTLRKQFFLAGMASKSIYADAFVPSPR